MIQQNMKNYFIFIFSLFSLLNIKNITRDKNIKINKKININIPLSGSFAKVCTELSIPDLTKKVPHMLKMKVAIDNTTIHDVNAIFFSNFTSLSLMWT